MPNTEPPPIAPPEAPASESGPCPADSPSVTPPVVLVRYGAIPEVAYFAAACEVRRGDRVVVATHRGLLLGDVLDRVPPPREPDAEPIAPTGDVVRVATAQDRADEHSRRAETGFADWAARIAGWKIDVELLDVERSLDGEKTTLYVLNGRDAEPTKLALQAAAAGLGIIDVQPVTADGVAPPEPRGGGCGSCGA